MDPETVRHITLNRASMQLEAGRYRVRWIMAATHTFHAMAFVENLNLKELAAAYPEARRSAHQLWYRTPSGGTVFVYPFGAMALYDVPEAERASHAARLGAAARNLHEANARDDLVVREEAVPHPDMRDGDLVVD